MRRRTPLLLAAAAAAALLAAGGCASGDEGTPSAAPSAQSPGDNASTSAPGTSTDQQAVEITVAIQNGKVTPAAHRVDVPLGSTVTLLVTSDVDDELHVHGMELEEPLEAGHTTTVTLQADEQGVFEVETHETELELVQLEVR